MYMIQGDSIHTLSSLTYHIHSLRTSNSNKQNRHFNNKNADGALR